jgi:diaminopimelate epimerase
MILKFIKYQGTGNDFIMIDERSLAGFALNTLDILKLCDRRFGIGADGVIIIRLSSRADFYVDYYNADGTQSFCGNGARCSVQFAQEIGLIKKHCILDSIDGLHTAEILSNELVKLSMSPVNLITVENEQAFILDTGSPHFVKFVEDIDGIEIVDFGKKIRFSPRFNECGINVNLAEKTDHGIRVKTYERGVEDETFSCGTGVTAVALADAYTKDLLSGITRIQTVGGELQVYWTKTTKGFESIYLEGPANKVYEGSIEL